MYITNANTDNHVILALEVYDHCSPFTIPMMISWTIVGIRRQCVDIYINRQSCIVRLQATSSINDFAQIVLNAHRTPKPLHNNIGNQLTADNNQVATADQDTHYKRQQSSSGLDNRLQEVAPRPQSEALEPVWSGSFSYW